METILLVDDDEVSNYLNVRLLAQLQMSRCIEIRHNGKEALEYLIECDKNGQAWPELILLDLRMPCMDGVQFLEEFNKLEKVDKHKTNIVLLSTSQHPGDGLLCNKYQIEHFLVKPLTPQKLQEVVV